MTQQHGGIPDLGARKQMQRFGASLGAIPLHVDASGAVTDADGRVIEQPAGVPIPRQAYLDGDQLLHAIQASTRYELRAFAVRLGRQDVADAMEAEDAAERRELAAAIAEAGGEPDTEGTLG